LRRVIGICVAVVLAIPFNAAQAQAPTVARLVSSGAPLALSKGRITANSPARPPFRSFTLHLLPTAAGYTAIIRPVPSRAARLDVRVVLDPPPGDATAVRRAVSSTTTGTQAGVAVGVVPDGWGISAELRSRGAFAATPAVPITSLTGAGIPGEVRAWPTGRTMRGDGLTDHGCNPPASATLDGFRAAVVRDKIVFTLHFGAPVAAARRFAGAPVTEQIATVLMSNSATGDAVGVAFNVARKSATYIDSRGGTVQTFGQPKIDVLGQNVLVKTPWRLGPHHPLNADNTFGTVSASAFITGASTIRSANTACTVRTASVRLRSINEVRPTPSPVDRGDNGIPPYVGLGLAFGGMGAIVFLALRSRRKTLRG
jgi:hypothetical protein